MVSERELVEHIDKLSDLALSASMRILALTEAVAALMDRVRQLEQDAHRRDSYEAEQRERG